MCSYSITWDPETVVDREAFKRMEGQVGLSDDETRELHGDGFAKKIDLAEYARSLAALEDYIRAKHSGKPHLIGLLDPSSDATVNV